MKVPQDESSEGQSFDRLERSSYFLCQSGETINLLGLCNGVDDCLDGSDEIGCINTTGNYHTYRQLTAKSMKCRCTVQIYVWLNG